jgi:predicted SAM-dependent methyltransferase
MELLNVACGNRFHKDWTNIDFQTSFREVDTVNILEGLPYNDTIFDAVYSGHFLEHLTKTQVDFVLSEIHRVLKHQGIVRVVVPDLENVCREYLDIVSNIQNDHNEKKYEWIIIELLDQMVRVDSGGELAKIYQDPETFHDDILREYIFTRVGEKLTPPANSSDSPRRKNRVSRLNMKNLKRAAFYTYVSAIKKLFPQSIKNSLILNTLVGERHLWMYDTYSLSKKLRESGFVDIKLLPYNESQIQGFSTYLLDNNEDGTPYKGTSSLYCEGRKP